MKKALITGCHGFLGRNVAREIKERGFDVTGAGHGLWNDESFLLFGIDRWIETDITLKALKELGLEFDVIVHCAGSGSVAYSLSNPSQDYLKTVGSTLEVLEYMRLYNKKATLVFPSSAAVYGLREDEPLREDSLLNPVSPYGYHKKMAEELCESYSRNFGLRICILRFFSLYGEGLRKQLLWDVSTKVIQGHDRIEFYGSGLETRAFLHVCDAAKLIITVGCTKEQFIIVNGGTGERTTVRKIVELTVSEFGSNAAILFNNRERPGDPKFYHADISRALQLGWRPLVYIEEGIRKYVEWFRRYHLD